jgi:hypothetical protein
VLGQNAEMKTWEPTPTHIFVSEGSHPPLAGGLVVRFGGAKRDTLFVEHHFAISSMRQDGEDCGLARAASPGVKVAALPLWHHELSTHGRCHYGTNSGLPKMNLDIFVRCKCIPEMNLCFISQLRRGIGM